MKIFAQKNNTLNENDRLQLATLLIKAGYNVRIGKENVSTNGSKAKYEYFVEAVEVK